MLRRRARHVVSDNQRVLEVAGLLQARPGDAFGEIGRLLTQSHWSLRDDFDISWPEADVAVDAALAAGALGARMIGGGFGGSVLALIPATAAGSVRAAVTGAFEGRSWAAPEFWPPIRLLGRGGWDYSEFWSRGGPMQLRDEAAAIAGEMAGLRHAIHREPEIGLDLPETQRKVLAALDGLPLEVSTGRGLSSVTAVLRGGAAGGPGRSCCCAATWTRCRSPRRPGCRTHR